MSLKLLHFLPAIPLLLLACDSGQKGGAAPSPQSSQASQSEQSARDEGRSRAESGPAILLATSLASANSGDFQTDFALLGQRNIVVKFELPEESLPEGSALLRFEILNPQGAVHSSKWHSIRFSEGAPTTMYNSVLGRDTSLQLAERKDGIVSFFGQIPVAGTNFTRYRLHGEFTAKIYLGTTDPTILATEIFKVEL